MTRQWIDNQRYFDEGGQAGFETKRGCPRLCIYCADPVAKGNEVRPRAPHSVGEEIENMQKIGLDNLHTCDCEFNIPEWHAKEICREIIHRNLGDKIQWYAYCSPEYFTDELARVMRQAGCVGIDFGADHGDDSMLWRLGHSYTSDDLIRIREICLHHDIICMFDLLLGSPGETKDSIETTIRLMKKIKPDRVGISLGVRLYPITPLGRRILESSQGTLS